MLNLILGNKVRSSGGQESSTEQGIAGYRNRKGKNQYFIMKRVRGYWSEIKKMKFLLYNCISDTTADFQLSFN